MTTAYHAPSHPGLGYPGFVDPLPPGGRPGRSRSPGAGEPFPQVDDQLVRPETREELVRGRAVLAMSAKEPHADCQAEVVSIIKRSTVEGYIGATELLTRAGLASDFATDACIRREGIDPATGRRYLEELAFEVVAEQSMRDITERAEDLSTRGVRRIIAIFVKTGEVREWSAERGDWQVLDGDETIEDHTLVEPIPVRALLDHAKADDTVARALRAKNNPVLVELEKKSRAKGLKAGRAKGLKAGREQGHEQGLKAGRAQGLKAGRAQGLETGRAQMARKAIETLCEILEIPLGYERRTLLQRMNAAALEALHDEIRDERCWP